MVIQMNDSQLDRIESLGSFLKSSGKVSFQGKERVEVYAWIEETLIRFSYLTLKKKEKGTLKKYLKKMTGYFTPEPRSPDWLVNTDGRVVSD